MRRSSLLYLTQADPHDVTPNRPALSGEGLRSYLMFYGIPPFTPSALAVTSISPDAA